MSVWLAYGNAGGPAADDFLARVQQANPQLPLRRATQTEGGVDAISLVPEELTTDWGEDARHELESRRGRASRYWSGLVRPLPEEHEITATASALFEPFEGCPAGTLAVVRTSELGTIVVLVPDVQVSVGESLSVTLRHESLPRGSSAAPDPGPVVGAEPLAPGRPAVGAGVAPTLVKEGASVAELVGMLVFATNPWLGGGIAVGGQVLAWIMGLVDKDKRPAVPTLSDIEAAVTKEIKDAHVASLLGEANSVWEDVQQQLKASWVDGVAPTDADYDNFRATLERAVDLSQPGTVHDNTSQIYQACSTQDSSGLAYVPSFLWSASVELFCWQNYTLILMAATNDGSGGDKAQNKEYQAALSGQRDRFAERVPQLKGLLARGQKFRTSRLAQVGGIQQGPGYMFDGGGYGTLQVSDNGAWPPPTRGNPVLTRTYSILETCCDGDQGDQKQQQAAIEGQRTAYLSSLSTQVATLTGCDQQQALKAWQSGENGATSLKPHP